MATTIAALLWAVLASNSAGAPTTMDDILVRLLNATIGPLIGMTLIYYGIENWKKRRFLAICLVGFGVRFVLRNL